MARAVVHTLEYSSNCMLHKDMTKKITKISRKIFQSVQSMIQMILG